MVQIIWSNTALNDLKSIGDFIRIDSKYYSKIYIQRIVSSIKKLELFPECGRKSIIFENLDLRELFYDNYRILYKFENDIVMIITIVHCKRDLKSY